MSFLSIFDKYPDDDVIDQIISLSSSSPSFESEIITESIDGDNSVENFKAFD